MNAAKGIMPLRSSEGDIFGVGLADGNGVSPAVTSAAKDALARMPVVDIKVLKKKAAAESFDDVGPAPSRSAPSPKKKSNDLLDLEDIFSGSAPAAAPLPAQQNGTMASASSGPAKSDVDLLSDIFSAPLAPVAASTAPSGNFDPFSGLAAPVASAPTPINPMDLFGAPPVPVSTAPVGGADLFSASQVQPQTSPMSAPAAPESVVVPGFSHQGLSVEFTCTKPDTWNKQKSTLIATFKNTTDAPIYGLNMQCAVPKYVQMDMQPATSTTVPQAGGTVKPVTQTIHVTNTMLGTKNLMLKLKVGFTLKGEKTDHMATCSGFPSGLY
jgi:AP-1 complex subunit gamma-1